MLRRIGSFFSAPVFEGDLDKTVKSRQLTRLLNLLFAGTLFYSLMLPVVAGRVPPHMVLTVPFFLVGLAGKLLIQRGRLRPAGLVLTWGMWLAVTAAEAAQGGVRTPVFGANVIIILSAAVLDGVTPAAVLTGLTLVKGLGLTAAQVHGLLPEAAEFTYSTNLILFSQVVYAAVAIALLQMATRDVRLALDQARGELVNRRRMEKALQESEQSYRALYETAHKQAQELFLESKVRTAMAQELDLPLLLRNVVESIAESFGYTLVSLYLLEGDTLMLQHQVGYKKVIQKIHITEGVMGRSVRSGRPILLEDVHSEPAFLGAIEGLVSEICIPLFDEGRVVGALNVESTKDIKLNEADLKLLSGLGEHVGMAIRQARLYSNVQRRNRILSALEESTLVMMKQLDLEEVLGTIVAQAGQILDSPDGYIYLVEPDGQSLRVTMGLGIYAGFLGRRLGRGEGLAGRVWESGRPINVPDYQQWSGRSPEYDGYEFHAVVGVPLISQAGVLGVLGLAHTEAGHTFSDEDVDLLNHFAKLASIALENARLYTLSRQELLERKRAEESLQMFRYSTDRSMDAIFWIDRQGRFEYVNDQACLSLGYTRDELMEMSLWDIDPLYGRERWMRNWDGYQEDRRGGGEHLETLHHRRDGTSFPVEIFSNHLWFGDRELHIAVVRDITERRRTEAEREELIADLERKNAELERFTYTVSHDLKAPLVTIRGFLGYLEQDALSGNRQRFESDLRRVMDATRTMQQLLAELVQLSRVGHLAEARETVPFADLVREAMQGVQGRLEAGRVRVQVEADLPEVIGDRRRLVEVLQNLIDNAAKYRGTQAEPRIEIGSGGREGGRGVFFVRDNGIGIAAEYHETIFGLFNKLDSNSEGAGMGLAIVKRIIEGHGGRIWVEARPGEGSTFYFSLPLREVDG